MNVLDLEPFGRLVEREHEGFAAATPFPHLVVDDLFEPPALRAMTGEFGGPADGWTYWHHVNERKRGLSDRTRMGEATRAVIAALETPAFLALLERLTGIPELLADPHLDGGGLHETLSGGFLNVHTDFLAHTLERTWLSSRRMVSDVGRSGPYSPPLRASPPPGATARSAPRPHGRVVS